MTDIDGYPDPAIELDWARVADSLLAYRPGIADDDNLFPYALDQLRRALGKARAIGAVMRTFEAIMADAILDSIAMPDARDIPEGLFTTRWQSYFCTPSIHPNQPMLAFPLLYETSISDERFGSIADGGGLIGAAENEIATLHDAERAFLFIDGSSGIIRALAEWIATWHESPVVGVGRSSHKAVVHHLDAYGVDWYYLEDAGGPASKDVVEQFATIDAVPPTMPHTLEAALGNRSDTTHVIVNSVTYEGVLANTQELRDVIDKLEPGNKGRPCLIADEAWGAHLAFVDDLKHQRALHCADLAFVSTHKMGGASQGAAALFVAHRYGMGSSENVQRLESTVRRSATTSPNFTMLSSLLDATRRLADPTDGAIDKAKELAGQLEEKLIAVGNGTFEAFTPPASLAADPLKVTLRVTSGLGNTYAKHLAEHRVIVEKSTVNSVTFVVTYQIEQKDVDRAIETTKAFKPTVGTVNNNDGGGDDTTSSDGDGDGAMLYRTHERSPLAPDQRATAIRITLAELAASAKVEQFRSADIVCAYPPGIPIIVPGERLRKDKLQRLLEIEADGGHLSSGAGTIHDGTTQLQAMWVMDEGIVEA